MKILRLLAFLAITTLVLASCTSGKHKLWDGQSSTGAGGSGIAGVYFDPDNRLIVVSEDPEGVPNAAISAVGGEKYLTAEEAIGKIGINGGGLKDLHPGDIALSDPTTTVKIEIGGGSYSGLIEDLPELSLKKRFERLIGASRYLREYGLPAASATLTTSIGSGLPVINVTVKLPSGANTDLRDQSASSSGLPFCEIQPPYAATLAEIVHVGNLIKGLDYFGDKHEAIMALANVVRDDVADNKKEFYDGKVWNLLTARNKVETIIAEFSKNLTSGLMNGYEYMTWKENATPKVISFPVYSATLLSLEQAVMAGIPDEKLTAKENSEKELRELWAEKVFAQIVADPTPITGGPEWAYVDQITAMFFKGLITPEASIESLTSDLAASIPSSHVSDEYSKLSLESPDLLEQQENAILGATNDNLSLFKKVREDLAETVGFEVPGQTFAAGAPVIDGEEPCTTLVLKYKFSDSNGKLVGSGVYRSVDPFEINSAKVAAETSLGAGAAPESSPLTFEIRISPEAARAEVWLWGFFNGVFMFDVDIFDGPVKGLKSQEDLLEGIGRRAPATEVKEPVRAALPPATPIAR